MVKSAYRVCQILVIIGQNKGGLKHSEILRALNIPTSSLSGLLDTLKTQEFLDYDKTRKTYALGPKTLALAGSYIDGLDIAEFARPIVLKLAEDTSESIALSVRMDQEIMIVCKQDSSQPIKQTIQIGGRSPIHVTASGKAILAHLPDHDVEEYLSSATLSSITKKSITDPQLLRKEVKDIRSNGLAYNREEWREQIMALAAPIFDLNGDVIAALSVSFPLIRHTAQKEKKFIRLLKDAANNLSRKCGFNV